MGHDYKGDRFASPLQPPALLGSTFSGWGRSREIGYLVGVVGLSIWEENYGDKGGGESGCVGIVLGLVGIAGIGGCKVSMG